MSDGTEAGARAFEDFMRGQRAHAEFSQRLAEYRRQAGTHHTITMRPELDRALAAYAARYLGPDATLEQAIDALLTEALRRHGFAVD